MQIYLLCYSIVSGGGGSIEVYVLYILCAEINSNSRGMGELLRTLSFRGSGRSTSPLLEMGACVHEARRYHNLRFLLYTLGRSNSSI